MKFVKIRVYAVDLSQTFVPPLHEPAMGCKERSTVLHFDVNNQTTKQQLMLNVSASTSHIDCTLLL